MKLKEKDTGIEKDPVLTEQEKKHHIILVEDALKEGVFKPMKPKAETLRNAVELALKVSV